MSSFQLIQRTKVESLDIEILHYEHPATGAVHYHLACDYDEKSFGGAAYHAARLDGRGAYWSTALFAVVKNTLCATRFYDDAPFAQ